MNASAATTKEEALWLLEQLVPGTGVNNVGIALRSDGRLRPDVLRTAIAIVLSRYEVLRTVYHATGAELVKDQIPEGGLTVEIEPLELSCDQLDRDLTAFAGRPFDLDGRVLVRAGLGAHQDGDVFCTVFHHLVFDAVSAAIFMGALISVYDAVAAGQPPRLEESASVAAPLSAQDMRSVRDADLAYWREMLSGFVPDGLDLWCGLPRPQHPLMHGDVVVRTLSDEGRAAVKQLQRQVRAPLASVLLAAYYAVLTAHGAGPDLVIGSPLDQRGPRASSAIGYHVGVAPLRLRVDFAEGFRQLTRRVRDMFLGAMAHVNASVDDLSAELPRSGSSWQTTLYRHLFNYLPETDISDLAIDGMSARVHLVENGFSKFDLELFAAPSKAEIRFRYSTEILARRDAEALLRRYEALLIAAAADPDRPLAEIAGWSEEDREIIVAANATARSARPPSVLEAFRSQVLAAPEAPAVVAGGRTLTYRGLEQAARAVLGMLKDAGVGAGDVVAAVVPRDHAAAAAALGSWLAGAVYLPLEGDRDESWLAASGARALLTATGVRLLSAPGNESGPLDPDPACVIQPTVIGHESIADLVGHFAAELGAGPDTGTLALSGFSSPASLLELFLPLSTGGRVIVAPDEARTDPDVLRGVMDRNGPTIVQVPPGTPARILQDAGVNLSGLRLIARAEEMSAALARELIAAGCELHGFYGGPGRALSRRIEDGTGLACGRPIAGTRASIVAPDGRELPVGVRGELCVAGERTGELARWNPDGTAERLGRIRRLVFVEGRPVNPAEVAAVLMDHRDVRAAASFGVRSPDGGEVVVAFAEVRSGDLGELAGLLREHAMASLDSAAVPAFVICADRLPTGADGQLDQDALELLARKRLDSDPGTTEQSAVDPLLGELRELWQRLLDADVAPETSFFEAGGHSLLAAKLAQDVEELTGIHLALKEIFAHPTPAALAARLKASSACNG
jgi:non-ribosomal peptide synthetase component F